MNFEGIDQLMEFLSQLGGLLKSIWKWFVGIAPTIDGICLSFITYYTFRLTVFPKKLKLINFRMSTSTFDGDSLEITLENRSLCPAVIESVDLVVGSKKVQFFRGECIVDGFKTAKIEMPRYSQIVSSDGPVKIDICSMDSISLLVKTTRGIQHIRNDRISRRAYRRIRKMEEKYERTTVCRNQYGDRVIVPGIRYAISYVDNQGNKQIVFIHKSGIMSAAPFGYNGLSDEIMENEDTIRSHFDAEFNKCNLSYHLEVFHEPFLTENVEDHPSNQKGETAEPVKKKKTISATTVVLVFLFSLSLSLTWDIFSLVWPSDQCYRIFPLAQSFFLAGYTWMSIVATSDIQVINGFIEANSRRRRWIEKLAHCCAAFIFGLPVSIMWLIDVIFNSGSKDDRKQYMAIVKQKVDDFDTKHIIVRTFAIPAAIILAVNILIAVKILPEDLIPIVQNIIDALVSSIGLVLVLANVKQKQNSPKMMR